MTEDRVRRVAGNLEALARGHRARGDTVTPSGPDLLWAGSSSSARREGPRTFPFHAQWPPREALEAT